MKTYRVVEETEIEDRLVNTNLIKRHIKSLKKAKEIAYEDFDDYFDNPYRYQEYGDELNLEYHTWKIYDEETGEEIDSIS